jgi:hypothetical protein
MMTTRCSLPFSRLVLALSVIFLAPIIAAQAAGLQFAGVPFSPGGTVQVEVPMTAQEKSYAAEGGNTVPDKAVAVVAFPPGFTPQKTWPILIVFSTSDFRRLNRNDLVDFYRDTALAEGWVVMAGDGPEFPRKDGSGWRAAMTLAALDAFYKSFPGSMKWPVACAGFSGGAKRVGLIAPILALAGARISGIYMTGINEDRLTQGYKQYHLGKAFLNTPVFISTGGQDKIALPEQQRGVKLSLERTGFKRVRLETFPQGHAVKRDHVREALRWFRSLAGSP